MIRKPRAYPRCRPCRGQCTVVGRGPGYRSKGEEAQHILGWRESLVEARVTFPGKKGKLDTLIKEDKEGWYKELRRFLFLFKDVRSSV